MCTIFLTRISFSPSWTVSPWTVLTTEADFPKLSRHLKLWICPRKGGGSRGSYWQPALNILLHTTKVYWIFFYLCIYSFVIFQRTQHICIVNTCKEMPSSPSALASWSITILKNSGGTRIDLISNYGIFLMEMKPSFLKKQLFKCNDKHPSYFGFFCCSSIISFHYFEGTTLDILLFDNFPSFWKKYMRDVNYNFILLNTVKVFYLPSQIIIVSEFICY